MTLGKPKVVADELPTLEPTICPRCGSQQATIKLTGRDWLYGVAGTYSAAKCSDCGLWHQNPRPPARQHGLLYPRGYGPHSPQESDQPGPMGPGMARFLRRERGYGHLLDEPGGWKAAKVFDPYRRWLVGTRLIPEFVPGGRLLDIGCGSGTALRSLRRLGWTDLHGIELVPEAAQRARDAGFVVLTGPIEDMIDKYPDCHFDVIHCTMVLEHLVDPFAIVRRIAAKLKPGGQFLFSTIDRTSWERRLYGEYWAGFDFPRHMVYFSADDLKALIEPSFDAIEYYHQAAPVDFLRSSSWRNGFFDRLVVALGERGMRLPSLVMAVLHRSTRVSVRCRRTGAST